MTWYNSMGLPYPVNKVIEEGIKIKKVPWVCCGDAQFYIATELRKRGIIVMESMQETIERHVIVKDDNMTNDA